MSDLPARRYSFDSDTAWLEDSQDTVEVSLTRLASRLSEMTQDLTVLDQAVFNEMIGKDHDQVAEITTVMGRVRGLVGQAATPFDVWVSAVYANNYIVARAAGAGHKAAHEDATDVFGARKREFIRTLMKPEVERMIDLFLQNAAIARRGHVSYEISEKALGDSKDQSKWADLYHKYVNPDTVRAQGAIATSINQTNNSFLINLDETKLSSEELQQLNKKMRREVGEKGKDTDEEE